MDLPFLLRCLGEPILIERKNSLTVMISSVAFPSNRIEIESEPDGTIRSRNTGETHPCLREAIGWSIVNIAERAKRRRKKSKDRPRPAWNGRRYAGEDAVKAAERLDNALGYVLAGEEARYLGRPQLPPNLDVFRDLPEKLGKSPELELVLRGLVVGAHEESEKLL